MNKLNLLLLFIFSLLLLVGCGQTAVSPTEDELINIRLPMGFIPDPQYAPFYVAVDKGYYAEAGFSIEFDYSFETDGVALVGAGQLPFAIVSGEQVVLARAQGLPVVYVMEWFARFPIAIVSKAEANIVQPADLIGRNVGIPGFFGASYVGYVGLLSANGMEQTDVNANEIGFNQVESLLSDQSEAVVAYANNEPVQLQAQGIDVNVIYVADFIDMMANGVITSEMLVAEDPDMVQRFVTATLRGLQDTLDNPAEAYEISKKFVEGLGDDRMNVLEATLPLWQSEQMGLSDLAAWQNTQDVLLEMGFLDEPLADLTAVFDNQFVE